MWDFLSDGSYPRFFLISGLDKIRASVADKELISSVLQQHPDSGLHSSQTTKRRDADSFNPLSAKTVLFILVSAAAALLTLAVMVGVICRIQGRNETNLSLTQTTKFNNETNIKKRSSKAKVSRVGLLD
jgi:hypothetical protein